MVATTPRNSIPYPQQTDAPNEATAMANMVGQLDRRLVPRFTDTADRTARVPSPTEGMIGYVTARNRFEIYRGGAWVAINFTRTVYKTADTSRTTTTTQTADPHLQLSCVSGRLYLAEAILNISADPGVDAAVSIGGPSGTTGSAFYFTPTLAVTTMNDTLMALGTAAISLPGTPGTFGVGCVGTQGGLTHVRWVLTAGGTGTLSVNWAQNVSSALATTVTQYSSFSLTEIA